MTELVHPAGDMGKSAAKRILKRTSLFQLLSLKYVVLGYEHETMGSLVQKKTTKRGRDSICGGTRHHDMQEWKHRANGTPGCMHPTRATWDTTPKPPHAMLGREDVTSSTQGKVQELPQNIFKPGDPEDGFLNYNASLMKRQASSLLGYP